MQHRLLYLSQDSKFPLEMMECEENTAVLLLAKQQTLSRLEVCTRDKETQIQKKQADVEAQG